MIHNKKISVSEFIIKRFSSALVVLCAVLLSTTIIACDHDEPDPVTPGQDIEDSDTGHSGSPDSWAPPSLVGKVIQWSGKSGMNNRIEFYNATDMRANWASEWSTYTWIKTGDNTGKLNFICSQRINYVTRVFRYNVVLTFTSVDKFTITGTYEISGGLSGNGTYVENGTGGYVDSLWTK